MAKLYPPYIEGSIPAFIGTQLTVPYEMNKTVGYKDISGFKLKIITVSTNRTIQIIDDNGYNIDTKEVYFNMPINQMVIGQFYKIQLAYKDLNGAIGFYSTIGVVKYSSAPEINIEGLQAGNINLHQYDYVGRYEPSMQDPTEVEIYYQFDVYDYNDQLYASSGKKIHNATIEGGDLFQIADTFEKQQVYSIKYTVWTLNGLKVSTRKYRLMERQSLDIEVKAELKVEQNYDEGYIKISLFDTAQEEQIVEGAFLVSRADSLTDYKIWNEVYRFELRNEKLKSFSFKDFTTQQGVEYIYSIQQYNDNGLYSNRLLSNNIKADFEDIFLYDGKRQLKVKFNPKVTSFKNSVLEQKVNTIGSKYPFIFRNGNVSYKEFPIGGLISYLTDGENLFINEDDLNNFHRHNTPSEEEVLEYSSTDLVSDNLTKERLFKLSALEWLTNGEPKLFRSPTEGNYIVRLLNTSMTPEQALGRMIHNFTATAYEVAEFNYDNLVSCGFIDSNGIDKTQLKWETVELAISNNGNIEYKNGQINRYPALTVEFTGMRPGDIVLIDGQEIQIGVNGSYYISTDTPIKTISIPEGKKYIGFMTYSFYGESVSKFNKIFSIELNEVPAQKIENVTKGWTDILFMIEDIKTIVTNFYYLKFRKADHLSPKENNEQNSFYPDLNNDLEFESNEYLIQLNDEYISIKEIETYEIENLDRPNVLKIGPDVICEMGYQTKVIDYNIENKNKDLIEKKNIWQTQLDDYLKLLNDYPEKMKKLEDQLNYHLLMKKTNNRVEELSKEEKVQLIKEIEELKNNDYYKLLTFEEAQDYTNINIENDAYLVSYPNDLLDEQAKIHGKLLEAIENKDEENINKIFKELETIKNMIINSIEDDEYSKFNIPRDPWNKTYNEILIEIELAKRENDKELLNYWKARREELYSIMLKYLPDDFKYIYSKSPFSEIIEKTTTLLYHQDGSYNYQPGDNVYSEADIPYNELYDLNKDGAINDLDRQALEDYLKKITEESVEDKDIDKIYDLNQDEKVDNADKEMLTTYMRKGSIIAHPGIELNIAEKNWEPKAESYSLAQAYYLPTEEFNYNPLGDIMPDSLWIDTESQNPIVFYPEKYYIVMDNDEDCIIADVDTYIGPSDPSTMEIYVDLWIDNSDITGAFEDSLQKKVDMFYYNGESYKDIAYLDPVLYLAALKIFNEQHNADLKKLQSTIGIYEAIFNEEIKYEKNKYYIYNSMTEEYELSSADEPTEGTDYYKGVGIKPELDRLKIVVSEREIKLHDAKVAAIEIEEIREELEEAVKNAEDKYNKIEGNEKDTEADKAAWDTAIKNLEDFLKSDNYTSTIAAVDKAQKSLDEAYVALTEQWVLLNDTEEKIRWLENSKDFLFNMADESYTKDGINTAKDYHDGGWCSAVMRHCIYDNPKYIDEYNKIEGLMDENGNYPENTINYYRELAYRKNDEYRILGNLLTELEQNQIENYYYTNQELSLEERNLVEDILMDAVSRKIKYNEITFNEEIKYEKNKYYIIDPNDDTKYIIDSGDTPAEEQHYIREYAKFTYEDKIKFDEYQLKIRDMKIERDKVLKDIPISIMDFTEPERYFLLFQRSHYVADENTKRPILIEYEKDENDNNTETIKNIIAGKGYCMYQFYDKTTAEYRVKQLEISIDGYIKKYDIEEAEVDDWLIRNDINERDELLAYLEYLKVFYPTDSLSAPGYNIFRPITLNEIINGKLYIEEELELAYKQYKEEQGLTAKRLAISLAIPNFYYKTGNYTRIKECQDRIIELEKILMDIEEWRNGNPDNAINTLLKDIKDYGDSLETRRGEINTSYLNYINKLEEVLKEEELK